jgi:hypothetical protein
MIAWAEARIPGFRARSDAVAIGGEREGELVVVAIFHTFSPNDCNLVLASDGSKRWATREGITRLLAYPFRQCGLPRITTVISEHNEESLRLAEHFGFVREGRLREAGPDDEDEIVLGLLRREWSWSKISRRRLARSAQPRYTPSLPAHDVQVS